MADHEKKRWIDVILMPLVVAMVGIFGTVLITSQQQKSADTRAAAAQQSAEIRASADRQLKLLEIFSQKVASPNHGERVVAIRLIKAVDRELAAKLESMGVRAVIEGEWVLRRKDAPPKYYANWLQMRLTNEDGLMVIGDSWKGQGTFDGEAGYYEWEFNDGKRGRTEFWIDDTGLMRGQVAAHGTDADLPSLNWHFWASRSTERPKMLEDEPK